MPDRSWNSVEVRFIDRQQVIRDLRQAMAEAKRRCPEIAKVFLFGSFVQGDGTADSDADLFVVVQKEFADIFDRGSHAIFAKGIPVDSVVYPPH
jgi:predicted nucleotidyltransferase